MKAVFPFTALQVQGDVNPSHKHVPWMGEAEVGVVCQVPGSAFPILVFMMRGPCIVPRDQQARWCAPCTCSDTWPSTTREHS